MIWTYSISKGELSDGVKTYLGYSGAFGPSCNNAAFCDVACIGPIPLGTWTIGKSVNHPRLGPCSIPLSPGPNTETYGRNGFFVHPENPEHPGHSSDGCCVQGMTARMALANCEGQTLTVII